MARRFAGAAFLCCLVSTVYASESRLTDSAASAGLVQDGRAATSAAPELEIPEALLQKLEDLSTTLEQNSAEDDAAEAKLTEFCRNLETPAHQKATELEAELAKMETNISATKNETNKEVPQSLSDELQKLEDEIEEQEAIMEPVDSATETVEKQREAFQTMLSTLNTDFSALAQGIEDGLTADPESISEATLLQMAEGEVESDASLTHQHQRHRFRSSRTRTTHRRRKAQTYIDEEAASDDDGPDDTPDAAVMGIVSYGKALDSNFKHAKKELTTLGDSVTGAVTAELTKRGDIIASKKEEKTKLETERDGILAEVAAALKTLPELVKAKMLAESQLAAAQKQIAKENNPCELYQSEFKRRRDHREELKTAAGLFLTNLAKDKNLANDESEEGGAGARGGGGGGIDGEGCLSCHETGVQPSYCHPCGHQAVPSVAMG